MVGKRLQADRKPVDKVKSMSITESGPMPLFSAHSRIYKLQNTELK